MSQHSGNMVLLALVTFLLSLALTPLARRLALRYGYVDAPDEARRVHRVPVPRVGGLAIYIAFAVGVILTFVLDINRVETGNGWYERTRVLLMLAGGGIMAGVMAVDDLRGLKPLPRLLWQFAAALLVVVPSLVWPGSANANDPPGTRHFDQGAGVLATAVQNPFGSPLDLGIFVGVVFTVLWLVGMTNTINWIDGLDALAGGVTVLACAVMFVISGPVLGQYTLAYLPLLLAAATLGFLPYNLHPARIFMGDSGAMFLGFTLGVISIIGGAKLAAALLVLGVPLLDGAYMIVYRLSRGRSPLAADRGHLHHRLLDLGLSQPQVVTVFYVLCGSFGLVGLLPPGSGLWKLLGLVILVLVLVALMVYISRREFDSSGKPRRVVGARRSGGS